MSLEASLRVRGMRFKPWTRGVQKPGETWFKFQTKLYDGLIVFTATDLRIVAVATDHPGRRKFGLLMNLFEAACVENQVSLSVVQLWNFRLKRWFGRRGYKLEVHDEDGDVARFVPVLKTASAPG